MKLPTKYDDLSMNERRLVREEYVRVQGGKCCHCSQDLDKQPCSSVRSRPVKPKYYPKGFFENPVHLHHSHVTGLTIGAVHAYCNAVLWEYHGE